ncbi:AMP-binding protein [Sphaerotilaceae bacterium SBD11-9]
MASSPTYHLSRFAKTQPDKLALAFEPLGTTATFRELEHAANRAANAFADLGLRQGDCVVLCMDNSLELVAASLGAQRTGLYYVLASTKLSLADLHFIVEDSKASLLLLSYKTEAARQVEAGAPRRGPTLAVNWPGADLPHWEHHVLSASNELPKETRPGREMLYTSGTTGRPKGVRKPPFTGPFDQVDSRNAYAAEHVGLRSDAVYLSTAPLYHAAPNRYLSAAIHHGATSIVMESFDAHMALDLLKRHRCTHSTWVPTMFHRLLKLPADIRAQADVSSMRAAVHGAAPCPVHVKEAMIAWWGPVLYEYYSGTEGIGATSITSEEWLTHKGSVGQAKDGVLHILDESFNEVPAGTVGRVYFESDAKFEYWNDPAKTARISSPQGWRSFGDVGHVDDEGYLYLTDRTDFTINSGGVKIYPQEIENFLLTHDAVADAAVFGLPNEEFGEEVTAVVQLADPSAASADLANELRAACRQALGPVKTPRALHFDAQLPRHATGKLYKQALRQHYLGLKAAT